jgi:hypothetical protein
MFFATAVVGVVAGLRSGAYVQVLVIVIWTVVSLLLLNYRLTLQGKWFGRSDLTADGSGIPHPRMPRYIPAFLSGLWATVVAILYRAPLGRWPAAGLLAVAAALFLLGSVMTFVPAVGMKIPCIVAQFFPGPSAAILSLGLALGPLTVISYWADLYHFERRIDGIEFKLSRPPVFTAFAVVLIVIPGIFNLHRVRIATEEEGGGLKTRTTLRQAFQDWATACVPGSGPIRPIIVAISGGASPAGLWGARVLEAVEEAVPEMDSPDAAIFAVSSVSGGSLGAATYFASLAGQSPVLRCRLAAGKEREARRETMQSALQADALGPLLASALFGDVPRAAFGWIPVAITSVAGLSPHWLRGGDRAEGLERAFEANWRTAVAKAFPSGQRPVLFDAPFLSLFSSTTRTRPGPIWIANGTDAQNGGRVLTLPIRPAEKCLPGKMPLPCGWPFRDALDVLALLGADVPISTAVDNTDRFPFLSPEGALMPLNPGVSGRYPTQVIDGGYFDNAGALTALELARWLHDEGPGVTGRQTDSIRPIIVEATTAFAKADKVNVVRCNGDPDDPANSKGRQSILQFFAPIGGINAVRSGHGAAVLREIRDTYCNDSQSFFHFYLFDTGDHVVPLNWTMSKTMAGYIWNNAIEEESNRSEYEKLIEVLKVSR